MLNKTNYFHPFIFLTLTFGLAIGSCNTDEPEPLEACSNTCQYANDGECDDGGQGSVTSLCPCGTDCADCGQRNADDCSSAGGSGGGGGGGGGASSVFADFELTYGQDPFKNYSIASGSFFDYLLISTQNNSTGSIASQKWYVGSYYFSRNPTNMVSEDERLSSYEVGLFDSYDSTFVDVVLEVTGTDGQTSTARRTIGIRMHRAVGYVSFGNETYDISSPDVTASWYGVTYSNLPQWWNNDECNISIGGSNFTGGPLSGLSVNIGVGGPLPIVMITPLAKVRVSIGGYNNNFNPDELCGYVYSALPQPYERDDMIGTLEVETVLRNGSGDLKPFKMVLTDLPHRRVKYGVLAPGECVLN